MKKGSEEKVSLSTSPIKSSASPNGLESDENDRSNEEMGVKNFMSPTVSAALKAAFPRKKILSERNEFSPGSSNFSKTPNLDSKPSPKTIPKASASASKKNSPNLDPKLTSKEPFSQRTPSSYNSRDKTLSPRPYDPLTNYLSPRPQFLRYNPSRRKEIFLRLEMEDKEGHDDGLSDVADTVSSDKSSSLQEEDDFDDERRSLLEQEDEEFDIESYEEVEEEVGWSFRGVLKYMFLLVVLVLSTSYISSMNSPTSEKSFEGLTLGYQKIENQSYEIVESVEVGYKFFDGKPRRLGLLGLKQAIVDEGIGEEMAENVNMEEIVRLELDYRNVESVEVVEEVKKDGKSEDACEEELIKSGEASDPFAENVELQEKETAEKIEEVEKLENVIEEELVKTGTVSDQLVEDIELQKREETGDVEKAEDLNENGGSQDVIAEELVKTGEVSEHLVEDIELQETEETGEQIEDVKENGESQDVIEEELMETGEVSDQMVGNIELLGQETAGEIEFFQGDQASLLSEGDHQEASSHTTDSSEKERMVPKEAGEEIHKETISMESAVTMLERWTKSFTLNIEEVKPLKGLDQNMGTEILLKVVFGFLTCAAIVASLVLGSNIRRKGIASKQSSLVDKHSTKPFMKEKPSSVLPAERVEHKKPLTSSVDKDTRETYQSRTPSVELLGEFEVRGISSSLKTCAIKSRRKDEVSSYSDFLEKGLGNKAYSASVQDQQDSSEFSTVNSNLKD